MAKKPTQQQLFEELLARYERVIADAFMAAVKDIRSSADLKRVIEALSRKDIDAAIDALNLDKAAYNEFLEAIRSAYLAGGQGAASTMQPVRKPDGTAVLIRFDGRNYGAEKWLAEHSSSLVTRIVDDQRQAVRAALERSLSKGQNPRAAGLDIVGRINPASGVREGGILGLTKHQEGFVANAREELSSSDKAGLGNYLTRSLRDKRFDRSVAKAIREGTALPADIAAKALQSYKNRLLEMRGRTIGLTEGLASLNAAKWETYRQAVETGNLDESSIRRTWDSVGDTRVRHTHAVLDGDTVGLNEPFRAPGGGLLMYPGDTSLGAPASETVNCRCGIRYRIDFLANLE